MPGARQLFRQEVFDSRRQRLLGDVVVSESRWSSALAYAVIATSLALVGGAVLSTYPHTETIPGVVVSRGPSAKVMAARPGVVDRVFAGEGQWVRRGQPLLRVSTEILDADRSGAAAASLLALHSQLRNLGDQGDAARRALSNDAERLAAAARNIRAERQRLAAEKHLQERIVASKVAEFGRLAAVADKGFISQTEMSRREQSMLVEQQRLQEIDHQLVQLVGREQDNRSQGRGLSIAADRAAAEIGEKVDVARLQASRLAIERAYVVPAPVDGRVTALQASVGSAVDQRLPLLTVIPRDRAFSFRLFAPSRSIGFIRPGQSVGVSLDAYPQAKFGTFAGKVVSISKAAYAPSEVDAPLELKEPVYLIVVAPVPSPGDPRTGQIAFRSGMSLRASISLERRTFLDWLLRPIRAVSRR